MTTVSSVCQKCGARIPADARQGVCPACQLETGLALLADEPVAGVADPGRDDGLRATDRKKVTRQPGMLGDFGDYEVQEEIGRGGQGVVYRARQKSLNRTVALKVIGLGHWATEAHLKRFRREAEAAASLEHPCIVPIHEVGERDGSCYFSMKFVEGGQLDEVTNREPMAVRRAVELIAKVARTVHYAHEHGILHRDIKPGNILLDKEGEPHLTDFGLARLVETESTVTRTLEVLGTPSYMAPEQAVGNNSALATATDVYGLGAVLYQLLTGHPPFAGGTTYETIKLLLETEPRQPRLLNPKIDRDLSTVSLKCLEKDPKRRYASALALAEDLERWLKHEPIQARRIGLFARGKKWVRRNPTSALLAASLVALAAAAGWIVWKSELIRRPMTTGIAVLPFENLSHEKENAFFADGVQDEILADLARIADLKVISRTSVIGYRDTAGRNVRKIGQELGVSHLLEGSVQRSGNRVRVNAQLIDARNDAHLWAQTYDRDLADVFAIQSEIAKAIADQLQAKLSAEEKIAIERPPTVDVAAFDLYTRASQFFLTTPFSATRKEGYLQAIDRLNQAVVRDPSFFQAYCLLARAHDDLYFFGSDHTTERLAQAEAAVEAAFRLRPEAGEAHLARAEHLYHGYYDYDGALAEIGIASRTLPNASRIFEWTGYIKRRQGKQEEALRSLERALEFDPRNFYLLQQIALTDHILRRFSEMAAALDRALAIKPDDVETKVVRAQVEFDWKADTRPLHQTIEEIRQKEPAAIASIANSMLLCAMVEHDVAAAEAALKALGDNPFGRDQMLFGAKFNEGFVARMAGDAEKARSAFTLAREEQEKVVQAQPNYGPAVCMLGLIDAALGRKEEALREGRRAVELVPVAKDSIIGAAMIEYLAVIAAWVGENELACEQLEKEARLSGYGLTSYGQLKLSPFWDPLRGDPCFERIVEEVKQPVALK
jgi:TolB-like protein/predicted Ser/Thr protein kinase/Tfp pilus assembly protein PilF